MTEHHVDVLVVGAGPTGLTAAGDLARAGRSVAVLERWPAINPSSRAFATQARTLEVLDARGIADDLLARSHKASGVTIFGGARIDLTHLDSPYQFAMITPQTNVDQAIAAYAVAHGADIRRGVEVVGLDQDADGVTVTTNGETRWRAKYLVAADGAHSTVRSLLGMDFPGKTVLSSLVLADVKLAHGPAGDGLTLGSTRDEELFDPALPGPKLLHRLYHAEQLELHEPRPLQFHCRCSAARVETTLRSFPREEMEELKDENGHIVVTCEYCKSSYSFAEDDLDRLYAEK